MALHRVKYAANVGNRAEIPVVQAGMVSGPLLAGVAMKGKHRRRGIGCLMADEDWRAHQEAVNESKLVSSVIEVMRAINDYRHRPGVRGHVVSNEARLPHIYSKP